MQSSKLGFHVWAVALYLHESVKHSLQEYVKG